MTPKKKRPTRLQQPGQARLAYLTSNTLHNICEAELHRHQEPVTHIDPATIDVETLLAQARLRR